MPVRFIYVPSRLADFAPPCAPHLAPPGLHEGIYILTLPNKVLPEEECLHMYPNM